MKGIYIDLKDIRAVRGVSRSQAGRHMNLIRCVLGKRRHQGITVKEFCEYEGISRQEFDEAIRVKLSE